jgi:hypothetical protein
MGTPPVLHCLTFLYCHGPPLQKENEVILYGGEWYDGERDKTHVYSDVYVLNVDKQAWKRVVSPNG